MVVKGLRGGKENEFGRVEVRGEGEVCEWERRGGVANLGGRDELSREEVAEREGNDSEGSEWCVRCCLYAPGVRGLPRLAWKGEAVLVLAGEVEAKKLDT